MKCEICGRGMIEGISLFRQKTLEGDDSPWRCELHLDEVPPQELAEVVGILEQVLGNNKVLQ